MIQSKEEIISALEEIKSEIQEHFNQPLPEELYAKAENEKWSIAQNMDHLIRSIQPLTSGLGHPKMAIKMMYGSNKKKINRSYDEIFELYNSKIGDGFKAGGIYVPNVEHSQEQHVSKLSSELEKLIDIFQNKWDDKDMDGIMVPHPAIGKITVRELFFFTIFHMKIHLNTIKELS